ncbi:MAG: class I SAM-dependent methyltransferase [Chloroflexota bacterium]|jgi:SAM-dependent methyltransferase
MNSYTPLTKLYPHGGREQHQNSRQFTGSNETNHLSFLYRYGWLLLYPLVLIFTAFMKIKNRNLAKGDRYLRHQIEFFSFSNRLQQRLSRKYLRPSDKFYKFRPFLNEYAFSGHDGRFLKMLDVATGCGFQAKALKDAGASEVIGIDIVPERLDEARHLFGQKGITFMEMDAADLTFSDDYFDATVVSCALHDMPTPIKRRAIAEMVRVTRPQGNVVIFEPRTFKSKPIGFFLGLVGELLDESINIKEFVMDDLNPVLGEHGLELVAEQNVYVFKLLNIKLCRVK